MHKFFIKKNPITIIFKIREKGSKCGDNNVMEKNPPIRSQIFELYKVDRSYLPGFCYQQQ